MSFVAMAVMTGVSTLHQITNKPEQKLPPANANALGGQGQGGITNLNLENIGEDTQNIAEDITLEGADFNVATNNQDTGIASALKEKLGAQSGKPISSLEDMTLEELLNLFGRDELTEVGSSLSMEDAMTTFTPTFEKPKVDIPPIDDESLISLFENPNPNEAMAKVNADIKASLPETTTAATTEAIATTTEAMNAPMTASEAAGWINVAMQGIATLAEILDDDDKKLLAPASAPSFSYQAPNKGITLDSIGMNMGGDPAKILARPMFKGDPVVGPGGPKDDIIPVLASDGEFMLSKAAVDHAGGGNHELGIARLNAFNNKGNQRYG